MRARFVISLLAGLWPPVTFADEAGSFEVPVSERGRVVRKDTSFGSYQQYVPHNLRTPVRMIVVVHGTVAPVEPAIEAAGVFINRWVETAERRGCLLIAPAFDQENYGGHAGPGGGYRGLFGRRIAADAFLNRVVDRYKEAFPGFDGRIYLCGHSAGGQFVSRYVVTHPDRIHAAVISAAGTFAFPNPDVPWTNGMAPLRREMRWSDDEEPQETDIRPDPEGWLKAAQLPIAVVVGSLDRDACKPIPGHKSDNHVGRARQWVEEMRALAKAHGRRPGVRLVIVDDAGHGSAKLAETCQRSMFRTR